MKNKSSAQHWKQYRLDEIALIQGGGTPPRSEASYFGGNIPWVTPSDLPSIGLVTKLKKTKEGITESGLANSSAKLIEAGSILFSSRASIGKIAVTDKPCTTNQGFANFTPKRDIIDTWFLAYLLCRYTQDIKTLAGKTTFLEIPRKRLNEFKVDIPEISEQRRIVARIKECLERVDEIEKMRKEAKFDLEMLRSAVFADYIESIIESEFQNSILGDAVAECKYGTSKKSNSDKCGFPIIRMGNIQSGRLVTTDLKHVELPKKEEKKYLLQDGDILINRTNSLELVGKSAIYKGLPGDWVYASYLIRLRVDPAKAIPEYVNAVINSRIGRNYVSRTARRAIGMVNINAQEIKRMPIPLPSLGEQEAIIDKINEAEPLIDEMVAFFQDNGLSHLRDSILRKAFAGEL